MRRIVFALVSSVLFVSSANAAICLIPFLCSSSSSATETATSVSSAGPTSSGAPTSSFAMLTTSSALPAITTSSLMPAASSPTLARSTPTPTDSNSGSDIISTASSSILPLATSKPTASKEPTKNNNIPIIIGSVCGFVALLIIGFAYAFFSRTRRNKKKQRLYSENGDTFEYGHYDIPNTQWTEPPLQQHYGYTSSPQLPLTNDAYYASPSPQMNYVDPNYYHNQPMYHQQPQYQQQPYESPAPQRIAHSNVYSPPNSYPEEHKY